MTGYGSPDAPDPPRPSDRPDESDTGVDPSDPTASAAIAVRSGLPGRVARRLDRTRSYPTAVLVVGLAGLFATTFPITILTLALPTIAADFDVAEAGLAWVVTLPLLASALALPVLGKLGDLYGHRRVFITGFTIALVATALTATAANPTQLIAWRTLTQVAGGSTIPSSLALINSVHRGAPRARAMGWWSMVSAGAPVIGLTIGAPVIDAVGWPALFGLQAAFMVVPVTASWLVLRETPRRPARFDVAGSATLAVGAGALLLGVDQATDWGVVSLPIAVCALVSAGGLWAFVRVEHRAEVPLVPLSFFRSRQIGATLVVALFSGASYMGGFFLASLLVVAQFGYSLTSAVPILVVRPIVFAAVSPLGGRLTARFGTRVVSAAGSLSLAIGLGGQAVGAATSSLAVVVSVGFLFQGIGYGLLRPALVTALADAVSEHDLGVAGAAERLIGQVGVAFGITVLASAYGGVVDQFPVGFAVGSVFGLLALGGALAMHRPGRHPAPAGSELDAVTPRA
ncbi:MFS transporter [soil metagenome]